MSLPKCKTECCECVQDGAKTCCYCDAGPNLMCLTEDFNMPTEEMLKLKGKKEKTDEPT